MNENRDDFYRIARKSLTGLTELQEPLGLAHATVSELAGLLTVAEGRCQLYITARTTKRQAFETLRVARGTGADFIEKARGHLTPFFGPAWTEAWMAAGFTQPSLALPGTDAARLRVLAALKTYWAAHPTHTSIPHNLNAPQAEARWNALNGALNGVTNCRSEQRVQRDERAVAETALAAKLQVLWTELEAVLSPTDGRWLKFMDRIPGDPRVPEAVADLAVETQPGVIVLDWPDAPRAARYKVLKQVVGVDATPVLVETVNDSDAEVTGVPAGATVRLQIVATNSVGDAAPSQPVEVQAA